MFGGSVFIKDISEISYFLKLKRSHYNTQFDTVLSDWSLPKYRLSILPLNSSITWRWLQHFHSKVSTFIPDCTASQVSQPLVSSQSKTNGSLYILAAVAAFGFDTEAIRCYFWPVQWIAKWNTSFGRAHIKKNNGARTQVLNSGKPILCDWSSICFTYM